MVLNDANPWYPFLGSIGVEYESILREMVTRHDALAPNPGVGLAHLSAFARASRASRASRPQEWLINQLSRLSRFNDDRERSAAVHAHLGMPFMHPSACPKQRASLSSCSTVWASSCTLRTHGWGSCRC